MCQSVGGNETLLPRNKIFVRDLESGSQSKTVLISKWMPNTVLLYF